MHNHFIKKYLGFIYINNEFVITPLYENRDDSAAFIDKFLEDKQTTNALFNIFSFSTFQNVNYYIMINKKTFLDGDIILINEKEYELIKNDIELDNLSILKVPEQFEKMDYDTNFIQEKYYGHLTSPLLEFSDIYFAIIENSEQTHFIGFSYDMLKTIDSVKNFISNKENYKITLMHTREKYSPDNNYYLIITGNKQLIFSHPEVAKDFEGKGYQFYKVFCEQNYYNDFSSNLTSYKELIKNFRYNYINLLSVHTGESHELFMHKLGIDKINEMIPKQYFPDFNNIVDLLYHKNDIELLITNSANDEYQIFNSHNMSFLSHYITALIFSTNNHITLNIECSIPTPFFKDDKKEYIYSIIHFENGIYKKINKEQLKYYKKLLIKKDFHYTQVDSQRFLELIKK